MRPTLTNHARVIITAIVVILAAIAYQAVSHAGSGTPVLITQKIDNSQLVTLAGNTRPEANAANDRGPVADNFPITHMMLQLRRSLHQERALERYIDQLSDPSSPNYHQWLSATALGQEYGLADHDLSAITGWLKFYGFAINKVYPNRMVIDFSGTAGQVREAFHTEIHNLSVEGNSHVANMSDPRLPAALAPAVVGVVSLNDFRAQPQFLYNPHYTHSCTNETGTSSCYAIAPGDLATIYSLSALYSGGTSGQGQTVVVLEPTDVYNISGWTTFRSTYGLAGAFPKGSLTVTHPGGCADPGVVSVDEPEAVLDAEWAGSSAPSATINVASCQGTNFGGFGNRNFGGELAALMNLLGQKTPPPVVSSSYGYAETLIGQAANNAIYTLYQTAAAEGVSVFVAAGNPGAGFVGRFQRNSVATHGITVNGSASTPYDVAVGGTDFSDVYSNTTGTYWSSTNGATGGSAKSYVPEIPWNNSCGSQLLATFAGFTTPYGSSGLCNSSDAATSNLLVVDGGSGGPSGCATGTPSTAGVVSGTCKGYPKPSWQSMVGNPSDGVRDLPDISLFASNDWSILGHSYLVCDSTSSTATPQCTGGWGGTSFAAPIMAGIQALVDQYTKSTWGNPNPIYYSLARTEYGTSGSSACNSALGNGISSSCIFYDVTQGDNDIPCTGSNNCYNPGGTYGVLSTSNSSYQPAYGTTTGWDFATGIGTLNANNLVHAFATSTASAISTSAPAPGPTPILSPTSTATPTPTPGETPTSNLTPAGAGETSYGSRALHSNTTGIDNTAIGNSALFRNTTGNRNTSLGFDALYGNVSGSNNSAVGYQVLLGNTTGSFNLGMGWQALRNLTTGSSNIGLGFNAGQGIVTGSNNIDIAGSGRSDESNTIRIGTVGTQAAAYIAGINTARVSGSTVEVNSQGRLGVTLSSARYKRDIHNMGQASAGLLRLHPVTFHYKGDPSRTLQYGLVAEQVAKHYPELVTYGADGKIQSVRYLELTAMLLNELQKQVRDTQYDRKTIRQLQLEDRILAAQLAEVKVENARELSTVQNVLSRLSVLEHTVQTAGVESRPALSARLQTLGREQP